MSGRAVRTVVRVVCVLIVAVVLVGGATSALDTAQTASASQQPLRPAAALIVAGGVLRAVGLATLMVGHALRFTTLREFFLPFNPPAGLRRTWAEHGRQSRQIDGKEGWTPAELPELRAHAEWELALRPSPVVVAGLIVFLVGLTIAPINLPLVNSSGWSWVMPVLSGLLLAVIVASLVVAPGNRRRAEAFLERTRADR